PAVWQRPRRPLVVLGALGVVALLIAALTVSFIRPRAGLLADARFINAADQLCSATPAPSTTSPAVASPAVTSPAVASPAVAPLAAQIDRAASAGARLGARLAALPAAAGITTSLRLWLAGWRTWANDEHAYAAFIRSHPEPQSTAAIATEQRLLGQAERDAGTADHFAAANALQACAIAPRTPVAPLTTTS
ncbi:MAG: hypothetical protein ACYC1D_17845, partial [Acidimicrobiales bacterium]